MDAIQYRHFIERVHAAFAMIPPPRKDNLVVETYDDENTSLYFSGKRNFDIPDIDLVKHYSSLWFFTDQAFVYYLPAFMIAALSGADSQEEIWGHQGVIWGHIFAQFSGSARRSDVISKLSCEQRSCLIEFFCDFGIDVSKAEELLSC